MSIMDEEKNDRLFTFAISLSVLDHLGRNLYRSFATVLGEAISNSWDANADNVWIYIDREKNNLVIKDDGDGMTADDFQNKFLKIGYSKRKKGGNTSPEPKGRPYIGRKGIGKLALLSCSSKITIISKIKNGSFVGGVINNSGLDLAITEDLTPSEYPLEEYDIQKFDKYTKDFSKGTIIYFEGIKDGVKNSFDFIRKVVALYFRFSLIDKSFNIFINSEKVTLNDLDQLAKDTEYLWTINNIDDPYIKEKLTALKHEPKSLKMNENIKGFIASVKKPRDLKITNMEERIGVDLFVNGRLRERDILKNIPTARLAVNYLYGQVHFDKLDDEADRFTSSRESIVADDPKYKEFLESLREKLSEILEDWDKWRIKNREGGDPEDERISKTERSSRGLYNAVSEEYTTPEDYKKKGKVDTWIDDLSDDAEYNFASYAECFISENLVRKHIQEKKIELSEVAKEEVKTRKENEEQFKNKANISIPLRVNSNDLSYLSMDYLANSVDKVKDQIKDAGLSRDANEYKPIRDALMHTALLTSDAKLKLSSVYKNIQGRIKTLLANDEK